MQCFGDFLSGVMHVLFLFLAIVLSCHGCPDRCVCSLQTVKCQNQDLDAIPHSIPANTKFLFVTGNNISNIKMVFDNLPNLLRLDLSNNRIQSFSERAFPDDNKLQLLNLNIFGSLSSLVNLSLQNSSIITIQNGTLKVPPLRDLDLRDNSLRDLPTTTLAELSLKPGLHIRLAGNPWRCDCFIDDMLTWLKNSTQVVDVQNLTCADPEALKQHQLLQVELSQLKCSSEMEGVLETSYVFLGLVLALIGVIFLLVLYLNRKGIKRWMYNIRDACRDHMEGYHYRYEINSDPRLANLSINSDV
uniref:Trophoblast glycoprotein n=1 Tax=Amphiprion percula TaxID=161767 RepID=A0A3P8TVH9_AMPPE